MSRNAETTVSGTLSEDQALARRDFPNLGPACSGRACEGRGTWKDSAAGPRRRSPRLVLAQGAERSFIKLQTGPLTLVGTTFEVRVPEAGWVFSLTREPQK